MEDTDCRPAPLIGRTKLTYDWIPKGTRTLLDGGCALGNGLRFYRKRCNKAFGLDISEEYLNIARKRCPDIEFHRCSLRKTPFAKQHFDAIILNDSLEHVPDDIAALNEMFRILKPGGTLIMTTPHKGLFSFMDPPNYFIFLSSVMPWLYRFIYRLKNGHSPKHMPNKKDMHRHYSKKDFIRMLDKSDFRKRYRIEKIFRSGLLLWVLADNLDVLLSPILNRRLRSFLLRPLFYLSELEYMVPFGPLSYHIAIKVKKR